MDSSGVESKPINCNWCCAVLSLQHFAVLIVLFWLWSARQSPKYRLSQIRQLTIRMFRQRKTSVMNSNLNIWLSDRVSCVRDLIATDDRWLKYRIFFMNEMFEAIVCCLRRRYDHRCNPCIACNRKFQWTDASAYILLLSFFQIAASGTVFPIRDWAQVFRLTSHFAKHYCFKISGVSSLHLCTGGNWKWRSELSVPH